MRETLKWISREKKKKNSEQVTEHSETLHYGNIFNYFIVSLIITVNISKRSVL